MRATFKLINSYFWKTIYGPIISFVFPLLLLVILGNIMRIQYVYPGIIALTFLFIGVLALPLAIMELKGSSLFKYIGSSPVNPMRFSIVVVLYYTFVAAITGLIIMFGAMAFFSKDVFPAGGFSRGIIGGLASVKGFFSFYSATFIHLLLVIAFGLGISTFSKTPQQALTIAIIVIIPTMFLSGMVISVDIIAQSKAMQWISRLIPFRYSTGNIVVATTPPPQLGDLYHLIDPSNRELIFGSNVITEARIKDWESHLRVFADPVKFKDLINEMKDNYKNNPELVKYIDDHSERIQHLIANFTKDARANMGNLVLFNYVDDKVWAPYVILKNTDDIIHAYNSLAQYEEASSGSLGTLFDPAVGLSKLISQSPSLYVKGDETLFNLIFLKPTASAASDNNIFNFMDAWAVRKIPNIDQIRDFLQIYLRGSNNKQDVDITRFTNILTELNKGSFGFMDIFLKQSNVLYQVADRSLNIFVPLLTSGALGLYTWKKFSWTSR